MAIGANMTKREQTLVTVAIVALGLMGAYWYFRYSPQSVVIAASAAHVDSVESMNRAARADLARGTTGKMQAEAVVYAQNLTLLRQLVPTSNEVPALLEDVSTAARRAGLDLATVEPQPVIPGQQFDTYRYKVAVMGGFNPVGQFLSNVGSLSRIVAPVALDLKIRAADPTKAPIKQGDAMLEATFQIQTYVVRNAPPAIDPSGGR